MMRTACGTMMPRTTCPYRALPVEPHEIELHAEVIGDEAPHFDVVAGELVLVVEERDGRQLPLVAAMRWPRALMAGRSAAKPGAARSIGPRTNGRSSAARVLMTESRSRLRRGRDSTAHRLLALPTRFTRAALTFADPDHSADESGTIEAHSNGAGSGATFTVSRRWPTHRHLGASQRERTAAVAPGRRTSRVNFKWCPGYECLMCSTSIVRKLSP